MSGPSNAATTSARHGRVAAICVGVVVSMGALAYASVPLYRLFCQVTGYGGTTMVATSAPGKVLDETITVRFDANVSGLNWSFEPLQRTMTVKIGETAVATYRATNTGGGTTVGSSSYNVVPDQAGSFFNKLQCFCFTEQTLKAGESIDMPVQFFIDPAIVSDKDGRRIKEITLSYTFYPVAAPKTGVAQSGVSTDKRGNGS